VRRAEPRDAFAGKPTTLVGAYSGAYFGVYFGAYSAHIMDAVPFVSCIMPTRNRRSFVGQAIWYFLRQDYPRKELIILDDGEDAVADLVPADERIRYVRLDRRLPLGAKRNCACALARGELIAHWDDDDWMAPHRLSLQVRELLASGADVCGAGALLHYCLDSAAAWLYRPLPGEQRRPAGGTLLYRRSTWAAQPFPELSSGEDSAFVARLPSERLHAISDTSFYVAILHGSNTAAKNLRDPHWERRPLHEATALLALDRDFYVSLRTGRAAMPIARPAGATGVTVAAPFAIYDGYGSMAEYLVLGMARAGATVNVVPLSLDPAGLSAELCVLVQRSRPDPQAPVLYFCWPRPDLERFRQAPDLVINTMWESSRLPASWIEPLNCARAVIVPTRFVADLCRAGGVTAPIEVVPEGIDPAVYHYEERPERDGLTTLIVGTVIERKHTREAIAAWKLAFGADPTARLVVKSRFKYGNYVPDDPRIQFVDDNEPTRGIAHWYRRADVLLALGNEGFGLPLVEGMATGLPVIALNSEGQTDICAEARGLVLPVEPASWQPYDEPPFGSCGVRAVPDVQQAAAWLRWVAGHRDEARAMGRAASEWAQRHRTIWTKGPAVLDVMERVVRPPRPLRRLPVLWTPSWGLHCGVAEYTAHLAGCLPAVRAAADLPDLRGARLVHVQHEDSLFEDTALTRRVQEARACGVPVVVSEHSVGRAARAWEREADALVAFTARGVRHLRSRWPSRRVEHIPHGCPTWFPPRKSQRGRVIGAFGFLERYKGFWHLLKVLRAVPDTELVLFSFAKRQEIETEWEAAAAGLPVRRERAYLPTAEIARRLAAEADILVFWYDDVPHASASGAVRVGLATGVPVLTSRVAWFEELREVTYQPEDLIEGVRRLLDDTALRTELVAAAQEYCHAQSWPHIAERHLALWRTLDSN
jgi:glycosyltransferase involved in cell wall biosynthesis